MRVEFIVFGVIVIFILLMSVFFILPTTVEITSASDLPILGLAPELTGTQEWINSEPLTLEGLKGKVVLIDFWTYSCINCIRTLPFLKSWDEKYADQGLVIIGVHTPEFEFEKDINNVLRAVSDNEINYPVVQDNDYATWRAYGNNFWPRKYILDSEGNIRYDHIGEGAYEQTEMVIRELLKEINPDVTGDITSITDDTDFSQIATPELFFGYEFSRNLLGNRKGFQPGLVVDYMKPTAFRPNTIHLSGKWKNEADRMIAVEDSRIYLLYHAKDVNIVSGGFGKISLILNDEPIPQDSWGMDTINGEIIIDGQRFYNAVSTPEYGLNMLEIVAEPGFEIYTFTFG